MRLANLEQRLTWLDARGAIDIQTLSHGIFEADPQAIYSRWTEFLTWLAEHADSIKNAPARPYRHADLGAPVPSPRQVFAIGLNYRDHAAEANLALPENDPVVFAKFPASITGPASTVTLPSDAVDYEAELVVVIGATAHRVAAEDGWSHVAGLTLGQDISDRVVQFRGPTPQFSLGKSYPGFSPIGPALVTPDEFPDPNNIALGCTLNGTPMQRGRTSDLVFSVAQLIASLSAIVALLPGDLIFTGTPAGIGWARNPKVLLRPGDRLVTHSEVIGEMTTTFAGPTT